MWGVCQYIMHCNLHTYTVKLSTRKCAQNWFVRTDYLWIIPSSCSSSPEYQESQTVLVILYLSMRQQRLVVPTDKSKANMQSKDRWPKLGFLQRNRRCKS